MQKPSLDLSVVLNIDDHSISITDGTDYSALGLDDGSVVIAVEITTPVGLLYVNPYYATPATQPDIEGGSRTHTNTSLPLSGGKFITGEYKVKLKWYYGDTEESFDYELKQSIDYVKPCVKVDHESDCFCANFTSTDATNYTGSEEVSYEHKIYYPAATLEEPAITGLLEWTDDQLANGVYVSQITTERTWEYGDFSVQETITGSVKYEVDCQKICDVKCAFNGMWDRYEELKGTDAKSAATLLSKINKATTLWTLVQLNRKCGQVDSSNSYMALLKDILGPCDCDDCESDGDVWVTGVCGSSGGPGTAFDFVFTSCNNLLDISDPIIVGSTKTFTFCLNEAVINTLVTNQFNALWETVVSTVNSSWFRVGDTDLDTSGLNNFPTSGTEIEKRQYILDQIAALQSDVLPVAQPDTSTTALNTAVENLVTLNDFFTSDVVVTITTAASNGTATVKADGKTLRYVPTTSWSGTDTVGYTITDGNGNTATSTWTIIVNPAAAIACTTVTPIYNASLANSRIYLAITLVNQTDYGTNVPTLERYTIQVRNASNSILHSYTVDGSLSTDPTTYITPDAIASDWNNVRILLTTTSDAATGGACGTETYETPTAFLITDIVTSWFEGTTIPASLGINTSDTEIEKKDKLMDAIDQNTTDIADINTTITTLQTTVDALDQVNDISASASVSVSLTSPNLIVREDDKGVWVALTAAYTGTIAASTVLISGLPTPAGLSIPVLVELDSGDYTYVDMTLAGDLTLNSSQTLPNTATGINLGFYYIKA